jgi:hypothetical protein
LAAFGDCTSLMSIEVDSLNPAFSSLDGVLFNRSQTEIVTYPGGKSGSYVVPNSVTDIGSCAFADCTSLTSITIPNGNIGPEAFARCTGLTSITIGDGVTSIGCWALLACTSLTNVTVGKRVTGIGELVFWNCSNLMSIEVDPLNPVFSSMEGVLFNKSQTALVKYPGGKSGDYSIPASVMRIESKAFQDSLGLTNVSIPESVTSIVGESLFYRCPNLTSIDVDPLNTAFSSQEGVLFNKSQSNLIRCPGGKSGSYTIPGSTLKIEAWAFNGCLGLTKVTIPSSVSCLGVAAFEGCRNLIWADFEGNAPFADIGIFSIDSQFEGCGTLTLLYRPGTTGWGPTYARRPTAEWVPLPSYAPWAASVGLIDQCPNASAETDDPDQDGLSNLAELQAGTSPINGESLLVIESQPRLADLAPSDQTPLPAGQYALYFQSVPGRSYVVQRTDRLGGDWRAETVVTATTSQKRVVLPQPAAQAFYRILVVP